MKVLYFHPLFSFDPKKDLIDFFSRICHNFHQILLEKTKWHIHTYYVGGRGLAGDLQNTYCLMNCALAWHTMKHSSTGSKTEQVNKWTQQLTTFLNCSKCRRSINLCAELIRKGNPVLQGSLVDSAWSWISTQTFHRTSDGCVAGRLAQELQMVLLSLPICWECVWADSWFQTMLNYRSCRHWSNTPCREKWFSSLVVWLFSQQSKFPDPFTCRRQLDYPSHVSVSLKSGIRHSWLPSRDVQQNVKKESL